MITCRATRENYTSDALRFIVSLLGPALESEEDVLEFLAHVSSRIIEQLS